MVKHYILHVSQFLTLDITAMQLQMHQYPFHNNDSNKLRLTILEFHQYKNTMHFWVMLLCLDASLVVSFTK